METSYWTAAHIGLLADRPPPEAPLIRPEQAVPLLPGLDLWDMWPVQEEDGRAAPLFGGALWFALSAPAVGHPVERHGRARLRMLLERDGVWQDCGPAFPDGLSPGSRDWSGSAVRGADRRTLTLYFTAAGRRGEARLSYEQRLFETQAALPDTVPNHPLLWSLPRLSVTSDGALYHRADEQDGSIGAIKAFRDPAFFRDPADGRRYLLFTGSAASPAPYAGVIGAATAKGDRWELLPPLVSAVSLNNELERPHLIHRDGLYYLFWSTQRSVFNPAGPVGPTGLYAMVAPQVTGPYRPVNDSGLVIANPAAAPIQAYSWLVLDDLSVVSFVDYWGVAEPPAGAAEARAQFGGRPAPLLRLRLDGSTVRLV